MKELNYPFNAEKIMAGRNRIKQELKKRTVSYIPVKIAIIGGSTTRDIKNMLELFLLNYGLEPVFFEGEYNRFYEEAVFENDALNKFQPDIVYIHTTNRNVVYYPDMEDSEPQITEKLEREYRHYEEVWDALEKKFHCIVIQNNFEMPYYRSYGNMDASDIHGKINYLSRLNHKVYGYAQTHENFYICDINYLSADYGLSKWAETKYWYLYKYALNVKAIPYLAFNVANIIKSIFGKNKKCIVLDLDNTLWGGVIGEDGVENIVIGTETAEGEMFTDFQSYLKEKQKQGVLLTIDSKNDKDLALRGLEREEMIVHTDDFSGIKANYEPKDRNLLEIADELQLLPESMVFIDDNPAELALVEEAVTGVSVVSMEEPEKTISMLDRSGFFEIAKLTADDRKRKEMYKDNRLREELKSAYADYTDYLKSLEMCAEIRPFEPEVMARIAQLTNKSNQFNLTTKRYTQAELTRLSENDKYVTLYGRLKDRFGDNGIVSVLIALQQGKQFKIDLWLMSCRVLKRNMEYAMFEELIRAVKNRGAESIYGLYIPTGKNHMVKEFYRELGFRLVRENSDLSTEWSLNLSELDDKRLNYIHIKRK